MLIQGAITKDWDSYWALHWCTGASKDEIFRIRINFFCPRGKFVLDNRATKKAAITLQWDTPINKTKKQHKINKEDPQKHNSLQISCVRSTLSFHLQNMNYTTFWDPWSRAMSPWCWNYTHSYNQRLNFEWWKEKNHRQQNPTSRRWMVERWWCWLQEAYCYQRAVSSCHTGEPNCHHAIVKVVCAKCYSSDATVWPWQTNV